MMNKKELALAVNFGKAPKELQDAVKASAALYKSIDKLTADIEAKKIELQDLNAKVTAADTTVAQLIKAWDPNTVAGA